MATSSKPRLNDTLFMNKVGCFTCVLKQLDFLLPLNQSESKTGNKFLDKRIWFIF